MRTTLRNPYYYIKDKVIFKIGDYNTSNDSCGKHYKKFDTQPKYLTKGTYYLDVYENNLVAGSDGNYNVSKGTSFEAATVTANKAVFPYFDVTLNNPVTNETVVVTYWLDDLIEVGDKVTITSGKTKFENKTLHNDSSEELVMTYTDYAKNDFLDTAVNAIVNGYSPDAAKAVVPYIFTGQSITVNGIQYKVVDSTIKATDDELVAKIVENVKNYGDTMLNPLGKECTVTASNI